MGHTVPCGTSSGECLIQAIDPGTERSAVVELRVPDMMIVRREIMPNYGLLEFLRYPNGYEGTIHVAIEMIASYGMPVGREVFETCVWIGRFMEVIGVPVTRVFRREVKLELCGSARAKDVNVRHALIDLYGPGKERAIGLKASPGPLYGFKADMWAALGIAVTHARYLGLCSQRGLDGH